MDWFEQLMGFKETEPAAIRAQLLLDGPWLVSKVNGRRYHYGRLEIPTLAELRARVQDVQPAAGASARLSVTELVGDVQAFHEQPENAGALFQAASQFNLLEMVHPDVTPEAGVAGYAHDHTQGPACAIACGAGTIYRNYLVEWEGQVGQSANHQVDCLRELGGYFENEVYHHWEMQNGYALPSRKGLETINKHIRNLPAAAYDELLGLVQVGIQWDTEVTLSESAPRVTQVYVSALPVAYSQLPLADWEPFAQLILDAAYEATFCTAWLNYQRTGNPRVLLTLVGGGAFGNRADWIKAAMLRSLRAWRNSPLEVIVVSYGGSSAIVQKLLNAYYS